MSSAKQPLQSDDLADQWERILRTEGLAPLDESIRGRMVVRPRVSPGLSDVLNARRAFTRKYHWRSDIAKQCWALYASGLGPQAIAKRLRCSSDYVKYTARRVERARREQGSSSETRGETSISAEVIQIFVDEAGRFAPDEPRAVTAYRRRAINLWRTTMSETVSEQDKSVSEQDIAKMLEQPTLELVKAPEPPHEKTMEEQEQEQFDAIVNGPFDPVFLRESAIKSFKYLLPVYLKRIKKQVQQAVARGAFKVPMTWEGPTNLLVGFKRELRAEGLEVEIEGTVLNVSIVPDGESLIESGQI